MIGRKPILESLLLYDGCNRRSRNVEVETSKEASRTGYYYYKHEIIQLPS